MIFKSYVGNFDTLNFKYCCKEISVLYSMAYFKELKREFVIDGLNRVLKSIKNDRIFLISKYSGILFVYNFKIYSKKQILWLGASLSVKMSELDICRFAYEGKFNFLKDKIEKDKSFLTSKDGVSKIIRFEYN